MLHKDKLAAELKRAQALEHKLQTAQYVAQDIGVHKSNDELAAWYM